jgi:hypothetical protein
MEVIGKFHASAALPISPAEEFLVSIGLQAGWTPVPVIDFFFFQFT